MSPNETGTLVLALLGAALVAAAWGWSTIGRAIWTPLSFVLLLAALVSAVPARIPASDDTATAIGVGLAALVAVVGGGPVTTWIFGFVDRHDTSPGAPVGTTSMYDAGRVLRGGAWIGGLERTAIVASLLAGWPEGVAISLAVKGLGRYPELRSGDNPGTAERFIIGTFTSVLWAAGCAGVVLLTR